MMKKFRNLSISNKLTLILFLSTAFVSVSCVLILIYFNTEKLRAKLIEQTDSQIHVVTQDLVKLLLYGDVEQTADLATRLRTFDNMLSMSVYNIESKMIYNFAMNERSEYTPNNVQDNGPIFLDGHIGYWHDVSYQGVDYGRVFVRVSTVKLDTLIRNELNTLLVFLLVLPLISLLLSRWMQRFISEPVEKLACSIKAVAENQDFSSRVKLDQDDELGTLFDQFNLLLKELQVNKESLLRNQTRLAVIIDIVGSAIISIDEYQKIIIFNRQAEKLFGYETEEILGRPIDILLPEKFRKEHQSHIYEFTVEGAFHMGGNRSNRLYGLRKNGEQFPVNVSISCSRMDGRRVYTAALDDISWQIDVEKKMEQYQTNLQSVVAERTAALEASNKELEKYSYSIAHDLRTPLRAITSFSQILLADMEGKLDKKEHDSMQRIVSAGKHMADLIDEILNLSKLSRFQVTRTEVDLSELVERIIGEKKRAEPQRRVEMRVDPEMCVHADARLIPLMMEGLLDNAWKYTQNRDITIIEVGMFKEGNVSTFFVKDNGAGFNMAYAGKLFREFFRLHVHDSFGGSGVGLASVDRIVKRHGGRVWAESKPEHGAEFYFTLQPDSQLDIAK